MTVSSLTAAQLDRFSLTAIQPDRVRPDRDSDRFSLTATQTDLSQPDQRFSLTRLSLTSVTFQPDRVSA